MLGVQNRDVSGGSRGAGTAPPASLRASRSRARGAARTWAWRWLAAGPAEAEAHRTAARVLELDGALEAVPQGYYNIDRMLQAGMILQRAAVGVCGSCMDARGIKETELLEGTRRSSLEELATSAAKRSSTSTRPSRARRK